MSMGTEIGKLNSTVSVWNIVKECFEKCKIMGFVHGYHWQRVKREGQKREIYCLIRDVRAEKRKKWDCTMKI